MNILLVHFTSEARRYTSLSLSLFSCFFRSSQTTSSCVRPGGRHALGRPRAAACGCMCLTTWPLTPACGRAWLSATGTSAMALNCRSSLTQPPWPTLAWRRLRGCCPIGCCATGGPLPTTVTLRLGPDRPPFAKSSVLPPGRATPTRAVGWSWTWRSVHMRKSVPGVTCATFGTNWESTNFGSRTRKLSFN